MPLRMSLAVILPTPLQFESVRTWRAHLVWTALPAAILLGSASEKNLSYARVEGLAAAQESAASLYRRYCQGCHGANGAGRSRAAADGRPNFTRRIWQEQREDAILLVSILDGKGTSMPSFQDRLSEADARGLVDHIRAFAPAPSRSSPSAQTPGNGFAAEFRQLQKDFEGLRKQVQLEDSSRQSPPKPYPRRGERRNSLGMSGATGKRTELDPGTHNRVTSIVGDQRRTFADDGQGTEESVELAERVFSVFSAKCASCHGADLRHPKGKFGYVLDLERVRSNPKLVVPSRPDESKLWVLIRDNEMPPEGAPVGSLSMEEKDQIRDWIAAGAQSTLTYAPVEDGAPAVYAVMPSPRSTIARPSLHRLLGWLGRFHVPVTHFPIALFLTAAALELWCLWRRIRAPWPPVRLCVLLGAVGSAVAVALGWLHADFGGYGAGSPAVLGLHRWLGTIGSCSAAVVAVAAEIASRRGRRSLFFLLVLFATALLIGAAGHFGGSLVHGEDFFVW